MDIDSKSKSNIRDRIEKLKQSKFKQQTLPAWRPVPTAMSTMLTFLAFAFLFLATGIVLYVLSDQIDEITMQYDNNADCLAKLQSATGEHCTVPLIDGGKPTADVIKKPIYVYYQLDNFYQNHRRYVKSRDNAQLYGEYKKAGDLSNCEPIVNVSHLWPSQRFDMNSIKTTGKDR